MIQNEAFPFAGPSTTSSPLVIPRTPHSTQKDAQPVPPNTVLVARITNASSTLTANGSHQHKLSVERRCTKQILTLPQKPGSTRKLGRVVIWSSKWGGPRGQDPRPRPPELPRPVPVFSRPGCSLDPICSLSRSELERPPRRDFISSPLGSFSRGQKDNRATSLTGGEGLMGARPFVWRRLQQAAPFKVHNCS